MRTRVADLIRSNIALALLCVISVGVLAIVFNQRREADTKQPEVPVNAPREVVSATPLSPNSPAVSVSQGMQSTDASFAQAPAAIDPDWAKLPSPSSFESFVYSGQESMNETLKCSDTYAVVLIYPITIDYRVNHGGYVYNQAFPCTKGTDLNQAISVKDFRLTASSTYYLIRANQSSTGTWYNPY